LTLGRYEERIVVAGLIAEIYRSSNGDRWELVRSADPTSMMVRHTANPSSGGQVTDSTVADFLSTGGPGPEYAALRRLLENVSDYSGDA
jgi:hypothetical protein